MNTATKTVYQYHGCKWHGCPCQNDERNVDRYESTLEKEKWIKKQGYNVVSVLGMSKTTKKETVFYELNL